jgi:hypothetical protein
MARDAQLAGDRVQTEYYLQYADHYFRVLEENRSRFDEQNQRRPRRDDEEFESESEGDEEMTAEGESDDEGEVETRQRPRQDRGRERGRERFERRDRDQFRGNGGERAERVESGEAEQDIDERIPLAVLPPAIGTSEEDSDDVAPKPRRRARKPRAAEGDEEVAPAA